MLITKKAALFMVNTVGHTIHEETNTKNIGDITVGACCIPTHSI